MTTNLTPGARLLWVTACALVALITGAFSGSARDAGVVAYLLVHAAFMASLIGLIIVLMTTPLPTESDEDEEGEGVAGNDRDGSGPTA
ncbi:hypothetical protein [Promicromonospora sp. NPDC090134]|uniref:hypothetical protein n=1 Tax=Promicromonospora sp. NPDC090134 TaxID=3364408 RepID=UPI0038040B06